MSMLATAVRSSLRQQCIVEPFDRMQGVEGYDDMGQPMYGVPRTVPCRMTPRMARAQDLRGDVHTAVGTLLIFAADDPISDRDRITLPGQPDRGPIIAQVTTHYDLRGRPTHKEVSI